MAIEEKIVDTEEEGEDVEEPTPAPVVKAKPKAAMAQLPTGPEKPWTPNEEVTEKAYLDMYQAFNTGNYLHSEQQIVKKINDNEIAIGWSDTFARKYWKPVRFVTLLSNDAAIDLAEELMRQVKASQQPAKKK